MNDKATIAPDGGLIVQIERGRDRGSPLPKFQRETIAYDLYILKTPAGAKTVELLRGGKSLAVAATPALAAPKVARVTSTGTADPNAKFYEPYSQVSLELAVDTPADAYQLVIYKIDADGTRGVAHGMPSKRVFEYSTGGKRCYGGFEPIFTGDRIAVAWLDVHGRLSARSATIIVGSKGKPGP